MSASTSFVSAMDRASEKTLGENASPEFTAAGVQDARVALFFALVRNLPNDRLRALFDDVLATPSNAPAERTASQKAEMAADAFLLAFQTRNCRGGKGEKDLFFRMIFQLSVPYPETAAALMPLVPHYGSYKDWFRLVDLARDVSKTPELEVRLAMVPIADEILDLAAKQLRKDRDALTAASSAGKGGKRACVSLLAKWAPREKRSFRNQVQDLARRIFPNRPTPKRDYRKLVSELNVAINTVEVKMSSNRWDRIDFGSEVPSVCMMKCRKAFLNEKVKGPPPQTAQEQETGNRHPDNPMRVASRKRLRDAMTDSRVRKLKGRQLFPHQVVEKFMDGGGGRLRLDKHSK